MSGELTWLLLTALLAASLWIPYIVGVNTSPMKSTDFTRPVDPSVHPAWVHRAYRAHQNLLEQLLPFAVVVLIAHLAGVSTAVTLWACAIFFWLRVVHGIGMITGRVAFPLRPIVFTAGWACIMVIGVQVLLAT